MKKIKYLKLFFFLICVGFLFYKFNNSFSEITRKVELQIFEIFFIFLFTLTYFNLINLRAFLLTKYSIRYNYSYYDWSKLYFESLIINSVISFTGTLYRAVQLKKRGVDYSKYIAISYLLYVSYISISLIFVSLELLLVNKIFTTFYFFLAAILILISLFFATNILKNFINFFFQNKKLIKYKESLHQIFEIIKKTFSQKKIITILCLNTITIHIFEIGLFSLVCIFFLDNINMQIIIILFIASFIIDRMPFFSDIPGVGEIILGFVGMPFGFFFTDGAFIKLLLRLLNYFSILLNSGVYFAISYYDKKKFVDKK